MTSQQPPTLELPAPPSAPDADWATILNRLMRALTDAAPTSWSDHNLADPGVTLAEVAAFGLADLHYRTEERSFDSWPLEVRAYDPPAGRHWHATLPAGQVGAIATNLAARPAAGQPTNAAVLEPLVRACDQPSDAVELLGRPPWDVVWTPGQRPHVIALLRTRLVRAAAHEYADLVASTVEAERKSDDALDDTDARAALRLAPHLPLWPTELAALVRRERRRLGQEALVARLADVRAATSTAAVAANRTALLREDLTTSEADIALAAARMPVGVLPEQLESADGATRIWPPHPIQALTCEPVTAEDYARRARADSRVNRAWAVPGRLDGVAWNGLPTGSLPDIGVDPAAAALTLVVERDPEDHTELTPAEEQLFLRAVLRQAIGTECDAPYPSWLDTLNPNDPRRVICDEVGAGLLRTAQIVVQGTVVTGVGVDPAVTLQGVRDRIDAFFLSGRGPVAPPRPPDVSGPWPLHEQPPGGWLPGDPIRFTEVIEAIVADPTVLGVEDLAMQVLGDADFLRLADGALPIPANAVPRIASFDCLTVSFALTGECSDA
ncbi:hypothetical protein D0Z08_30200 [Nocardioides immobilis]|uniref:Uncharacterized protein n=1 Tax=Nocardioides immobilis TaxID=2049295 RepID=A0A417XSB1_9ACTN|nr:hypothetical protein [Nocardioides immobilis]RHW23364.1 hypothetical protein D0Z08_30200 [Nocardioides immobilis]